MPSKDLHHELLDEPFRFEFFQAVRLLEKMFPERRPVGRDALPGDEIARFRSRMSLRFPASEIHEFKETTDEFTEKNLLEMFVNFMGMAGASGVLPVHYTELLVDRDRYRDRAMWTFLDIFTHRAVSLFFRAWEKYRFPVAYERGDDDFTHFLFDFIGQGTGGLRGRMSLPDESLLPYVGLIAQRPHSANALANILSDYFGVAVEIEQFFGIWLDLEERDWTLLGSQNSALGATTIAGTRVREQQSKFRLRVGALTFEKFRSFLPNGTAHQPLRSIVKFMAGGELDFDTQLILKKKEVPSCILTTRAVRRPLLGWTTWLKSQPFAADDEQVILAFD